MVGIEFPERVPCAGKIQRVHLMNVTVCHDLLVTWPTVNGRRKEVYEEHSYLRLPRRRFFRMRSRPGLHRSGRGFSAGGEVTSPASGTMPTPVLRNGHGSGPAGSGLSRHGHFLNVSESSVK